MPTRGRRSTSAQTAARSCSSSGARRDEAVARLGAPEPRPEPGRALRSTLPLGVRGSASSATKAEGTMYSGSRCLQGRRAAAPCPRASRRRRRPGACRRATSSRASTTASRTPGAQRGRPRSRPARCGSRAPSPGSRARPRNSSVAVGAASAPGRRCGTGARRARRRRGRGRSARRSARAGPGSRAPRRTPPMNSSPGHAHGHRPQARVEHVEPRVGDGPADGDGGAGRRSRHGMRQEVTSTAASVGP